MGDVQFILGTAGAGAGEGAAHAGPFRRRAGEGAGGGAGASAASGASKKVNPKKRGMARELQGLLASTGAAHAEEAAVPLVPSVPMVLGQVFKAKRGAVQGTRWQWKPFVIASRRDGAQLSHWVRSDMETPDYPFSRFNKRLDIVRYSDAEYRELLTPSEDALKIHYLQQQGAGSGQPSHPLRALSELEKQNLRWSREATDHLFDLARRYDLQWHVVMDRFESKPLRTMEDLKTRFYTATSKVLLARRARLPRGMADQAHSNYKEYEGFKYHPEEEQRRRKQLEAAFRRTNEDLAEEKRLLKELQVTEASIRRLEVGLQKGRKATAAAAAALLGSSASASGEGMAVEAAAAGQGGGAGGAGSSGVGEAVFAGSDTLIARSIATKARAPNVLGLGGVGGGRVLGPTDIIGQLSAMGAAEAASAAAAGGGAGAGGAAVAAAAAAAVAVAAAAAADPFSAATAPIARRSAQIAAPVDGEYADGRTTARIAHFLALAGQTDKVAVPTGETLLQHAQLRRESAAMIALAKAVEAEEQAVFKLERLRKQATFVPFQAEAAPLAGVPGAGGGGGRPAGAGGSSGAPRQQQQQFAEGGGAGGGVKRQLEDADGSTAKVARRN